MKKKIIYGLLIVVIGIQFIRTNEGIPEIEPANDFIVQLAPPEDVAKMIRTSCYDCHSYQTKIPWYGQIAPVSWYVNNHINEGRRELNFNEWGTYKLKRKKHKLKESIEEIEEKEMPMDEYFIMHGDAELTDAQRQQLIDWLKSINLDPPAPKNELHLNNGEKWEMDSKTDSIVQNMVNIITQDIPEGRISYYTAMAQKITMELDNCIPTSSLIGENEMQLTFFLSPVSEMAMKLEETENEDEAMILQKDILKQLNKYHKFFEVK